MRKILIGIACTLIAAAASGAGAEARDGADPTTVHGVVVTGHGQKRQGADNPVRSFVTEHAQRSLKTGQVARWRDPVCPVVRNLPPEFDDFIARRIREVAASVGAPLKEPCTPNIEVIFVDDPQSVMDEVAKHQAVLLGAHWASQSRALATVRQPIQAWYATDTTNGVQTWLDDAYGQTPGGSAGSAFGEGLRSVLDHVLILADGGVVSGQPVGPVADYIAMLALAQPRSQDGCGQLPSIFDLMPPGCPGQTVPQSLTAPDVAYLKALYSAEPGFFGHMQVSVIAQRMTRGLDASQGH